eukprot:223515_1
MLQFWLLTAQILTAKELRPCVPNRECFSQHNDFTNVGGYSSSQYICDGNQKQLVTYSDIGCNNANEISREDVTDNSFICTDECSEYVKFKFEMFINQQTCDNSSGWMEFVIPSGCQSTPIPLLGQNANLDSLVECTETSVSFTVYLQSNIFDDTYCDDNGNYDGDYIKLNVVQGCHGSPLLELEAKIIANQIGNVEQVKSSSSLFDSFRYKLDVQHCGYSSRGQQLLSYQPNGNNSWIYAFIVCIVVLIFCVVAFGCIIMKKNNYVKLETNDEGNDEFEENDKDKGIRNVNDNNKEILAINDEETHVLAINDEM